MIASGLTSTRSASFVFIVGHEALRDPHEVAQVRPGEPDGEGQLASLVVEEPEERVGLDAVDRLRGDPGHLLDLDPALGRGHEHDPPAGPVEDRPEVELLDDHRGRPDEDLADGDPLDVHAEDRGRRRPPPPAGEPASFTPPALPRPPTRTWALITTRPAPSARNRSAAARASPGVRATAHGGTGSPAATSSDFASASWIFTGGSWCGSGPGGGLVDGSARDGSRRGVSARPRGGRRVLCASRGMGTMPPPPDEPDGDRGTAAVARCRPAAQWTAAGAPRRAPARRRVSRCSTCSTEAGSGCWRGRSTASRAWPSGCSSSSTSSRCGSSRPIPSCTTRSTWSTADPGREIGEILLGAALLYHALNGLRIIVMDFWPATTVYHRQLWIASLGRLRRRRGPMAR